MNEDRELALCKRIDRLRKERDIYREAFRAMAQAVVVNESDSMVPELGMIEPSAVEAAFKLLEESKP